MATLDTHLHSHPAKRARHPQEPQHIPPSEVPQGNPRGAVRPRKKGGNVAYFCVTANDAAGLWLPKNPRFGSYCSPYGNGRIAAGADFDRRHSGGCHQVLKNIASPGIRKFVSNLEPIAVLFREHCGGNASAICIGCSFEIDHQCQNFGRIGAAIGQFPPNRMVQAGGGRGPQTAKAGFRSRRARRVAR